jgi:hypothetical protein
MSFLTEPKEVGGFGGKLSWYVLKVTELIKKIKKKNIKYESSFFQIQVLKSKISK